MAHILDINTPDVQPTGAPGNDYQRIDTNANMFGGFGAQATEKLGQGLSQAGETGLSVLTARQGLNNEIHAGEINSWLADRLTDEYSNYSRLEGKAAQEGLPAFKQKIESLRQQAIGQAGNLQTQALVSNANRYLTDKFYSYGTGHADKQFRVWADKTATDRATNYAGIAAIAASHNDQEGFATALNTSDDEVRKLYEQKGYDPESIDLMVGQNRSRNLKTIIELRADQDPAQAQAMYEKYKGDLKPVDQLAASNKLKSINVNTEAIKRVNKDFAPPQFVTQPALDYIGQRYNISGSYLARTHQLEGNGTSKTGAQGPYQFTGRTAAKYGLTDPFNFTQSADAAARLAADNKTDLTKSLGREPTDAELYLAHQQGSAGASALLRNPNLPAAQALAPAYNGDVAKAAHAIAVNGGDPNAPASTFTQMWINKFNGASGAVSGTEANNYYQRSKSDAMDRVLTDPELQNNPPLRNAMIQEINRRWTVENARYTDEQRMEREKTHAENEAYRQGTDELLTGLINNDPSWTAQRVLSDPRFAKNREHALALLQAKNAGQADTATYGKGFYDIFRRIHSAPDDPNRITDDSELYNHLGPGGDLTLSGLNQLRQEIAGKKTPDGAAEAEMKKQFFTNAHHQISGTNEGLHLRDPKGDELYLKFMAQALPLYDKERKAGKTAAQLLNPDSSDYIGKSIASFKRPMNQWFSDNLNANAPGAQSAPAPDMANLQPTQLIEMVHSGKMTREEGEKIALKNGWIKPTPAPGPQVPISQ